jgi:hypothetical protein
MPNHAAYLTARTLAALRDICLGAAGELRQLWKRVKICPADFNRSSGSDIYIWC